MSYAPPVVARALDPDAIIDGARAALLASSAVAAITTGIYPEIAPEGAGAPYIILALASTTYESTYASAVINSLLDVSCYAAGASTTVVRALMTACVAALIDTAWTIPGLAKITANMEEAGAGFRSLTTVENGVVIRGRQATIRVRAAKV